MTNTSPTSPKDDSQRNENSDQIAEELDPTVVLQDELDQAKDAERRARADYQNLVRRTQQERQQLIKLATKSLVSDLVQPVEHLSLAAEQLNDKGLNMVVHQFWQVLETHGLQEINPVGEKFNLETMEAVDTQDEVSEEESVVKSVVKRGYRLNGAVIQHAKVVVGRKK